MSIFTDLVDSVLESHPDLAIIRPVVEKEILHHDILRMMSSAGFLAGLVFMGGTCLRVCYGSQRLSEDLDFLGGQNFNREDLKELGQFLQKGFFDKYGLSLTVSDPVKESGNTDTWKLKLITRPDSLHLPAQRINIDISSLDAFEPKPAVLINHYSTDMGTSGLIILTESLEEILADKIIALAMRPNRIKNRDLWDIMWLKSKNILLNRDFVLLKVKSRKLVYKDFLAKLTERQASLQNGKEDFEHEMQRFLLQSEARQIKNPLYWPLLRNTLAELAAALF